MTIKPREVERALRAHGWYLKSTKGTHQKWEDPKTGRCFIMSGAGSRRNNLIHMNNVNDILKEIGLYA